ncbi:pseudouridine synthase [Haloferula sp. BvORR071]|uniref:RluA family pseudouridine synthase n=1 Tax=Haloferula sp. BvORR071 TaxID=1396141 RepID=UPI0006966C5C|nr:pseudouridine synthase [Haloferula sp. BvORR071]
MQPLRYLYRDEYLVAIDKPAGMIVHAGRDEEGPEWIAMKRVRDEVGHEVHVVHRLDRPTSGVLLFALDRKTCALIQQIFELRRVQKSYLAVVEGAAPLQWVCDTPLRKSPEEPLLHAETAFERQLHAGAGSFGAMPGLELSLLEAKPHTGRYHQIRRHLQMTGHAIVGDYRYAGAERCNELGELLGTGTRMLLQAKALELEHPYSGEMLRIEAPADPDFCRCFPSLELEVA